MIISVLSAACATAQQPAGDYNTSDVAYSTDWLPARATWYGAPTGAGPNDNGTCPDCGCLMQQCLCVFCCRRCLLRLIDVYAGGACGFKHVNQYPFSSMTSCGNQPIFKDGKGCGSCYQVAR